jgi:hypothetical protein
LMISHPMKSRENRPRTAVNLPPLKRTKEEHEKKRDASKKTKNERKGNGEKIRWLRRPMIARKTSTRKRRSGQKNIGNGHEINCNYGISVSLYSEFSNTSF